MARTFPLALLLLLAGCDSDPAGTDAGSTEPDAGPMESDAGTDAGPVDDGLTGTCTASNTTSTSVIDTGSGWAYYDLDTASEVTATDGWDLRMERWMLELNTGVEVAGYEGAYHRLRFDGYAEGGDLHTPGITHGEISPPE